MNDRDPYFDAVSSHEVPASALLEYANRMEETPEEEMQNLRDQLAREIEEKYPYMPGQDPDMPGKTTAEVAFFNANLSIGYAARHYFDTKKDRITLFILHAHLNIGDIQKRINSIYRRCLAGRMNIGYCRDNEFSEKDYLHNSDNLAQYWSYLKPFLDEGKQLRIWYSENPAELCGFYHLCTYLKKYDQDFFAVKVPEIEVYKGKPEKIYSWTQLSEEKIRNAVENTRLLSKEEITANAKVWEKLKKENAPLRVVIDGQLVSVPEFFYDPWILSCIPTDEPKEIVEIHDQIYKHIKTIESGWLIHRIENLIRRGKVELVEDHEYVWKQLIRRK